MKMIGKTLLASCVISAGLFMIQNVVADAPAALIVHNNIPFASRAFVNNSSLSKPIPADVTDPIPWTAIAGANGVCGVAPTCYATIYVNQHGHRVAAGQFTIITDTGVDPNSIKSYNNYSIGFVNAGELILARVQMASAK